MATLRVPGAEIAYRVSGSGPALLAPERNYSWDPAFEELMARRFTVIVASPRDFGPSTRPGPPYTPELWASDLSAVARHLGRRRFFVFGFSFTGAFGPWLARQLAREDAAAAVVSGGFPLLGDYRITARDVDAQLSQLEKDPDAWATYSERFDLRAGAAFYRDLARLPPDALVDQAPCPLYCFWGDRDSDAVEMVLPHEVLADGLSRRGVPWQQHAGHEHESLNNDLAVAWPAAEAWLLRQARNGSLAP